MRTHDDDYTVIFYYKKSLEILQKTVPANHPLWTTSYHNIAEVYKKMHEYPQSLSSVKKSLEIRQQTLTANHSSSVNACDIVDGMFHSMKEYLEALSCYDKALGMLQKILPAI